MIKNSFISLHPNSKERTDAIGSIKYTLLLDYHVPTINSDTNPIEQIMESCQACCQGLFVDKTSNAGDSYSFFGDRILSNKYNNLYTSPLGHLDFFRLPKDIKLPQNLTLFHTMLLHHCILSSYHAILTELLNDQWVTSYSIENKIQHNGLYHLNTNNVLFFENKTIFHLSNKNSKKQSSQFASDFQRITKTHISALPQIMEFFAKEDTSGKSAAFQYKLQFSSLFYSICEIEAPKWKKLNRFNKFKGNNIYEKLNLFNTIETLTKIMPRKSQKESFFYIKPNDQTHKLTVPDALYHAYLTERIFNFNLFYSLLKNIKRIEDKTPYRLTQAPILSILENCKKLPNSFSRQYFLTYAFNQFFDEPFSYYDFWYKNDLDRSEIMMENTRSIQNSKKGFQLFMWQEQFERFVQYLSEFVIPVYEWCFIGMLMESIEQSHPTNTHTENLICAMNHITDYMNKNYQTISQPVSILPSNKEYSQDILDIISKHQNIEELCNLPSDAIQHIAINFFCSSDDVELNLTPLNPDFFKTRSTTSSSMSPQSNRDLIRKFYITLFHHYHF